MLFLVVVTRVRGSKEGKVLSDIIFYFPEASPPGLLVEAGPGGVALCGPALAFYTSSLANDNQA
jgi:hypothetical protein